jgi:quercetin dioxygenase-like cupin family protein
MNKSMLVAAVLAVAALARADDAKTPSTEDAFVANRSSAQLKAVDKPGIPAGVEAALVAKDPATGGTVAYAKIPAGVHFPMHWHSHAEYSVLLSGKAEFTLDGKKHEIGEGSYFVIPAKVHHELTCAADADCVLLTRRAGPTDYHWVK